MLPSHIWQDGFFERALPGLYGRLRHAAHAAAEAAGWSAALLHDRSPVNLRCVEYHTMHAGGGLLSKRHRDDGAPCRLRLDSAASCLTWLRDDWT
jgi:hypothetical protein